MSESVVNKMKRRNFSGSSSIIITSVLSRFTRGTLTQKGLMIPIFAAALVAAPLLPADESFARAGRGRSAGRSVNRSAPPAQRVQPPPPSQTPQAQPGAPAPQQVPSGGSVQGPNPAGAPFSREIPQARQSGGLMRNMATAVAGGFLGSMLFSGLSHGLSGGTNPQGLGGSGGEPLQRSTGIGLLEILLLGAAGYLGYRVYKNRQEKLALQSHMANQYSPSGSGLRDNISSTSDDRLWINSKTTADSSTYSHSTHTPRPTFMSDPEIGLAHSTSQQAGVVLSDERTKAWDGKTGSEDLIDEAHLKNRVRDIFYRVQTAWSRRDLSGIKSLLTSEMLAHLQYDLEDLLKAREINRLENISITQVDIDKVWHEDRELMVGVLIGAYMLDYTVDELSQDLVRGSQVEPIKFEETWVFKKLGQGSDWVLAGIQVG